MSFIIENKNLFLKELKEIDREGMEEFIEWIQKTDFFKAPASTQYHGSFEGGLCYHSLNVLEQLRKLNNCYKINADIDSITLVALLHDICKIATYEKSTKNVQQSDGSWKKEPFYKFNEKLKYGHGSKSVLLIMRRIKLSMEEIMAIRYHMGAYEGFKDFQGMQDNFKEYPLAMFTHIADLLATNLEEGGAY